MNADVTGSTQRIASTQTDVTANHPSNAHSVPRNTRLVMRRVALDSGTAGYFSTRETFSITTDSSGTSS